MPTSAVDERNQGGNRNLLGSSWIVYALIRMVVVILLILYSGTATVMFGTLLSRAPNPFFLMSVFHFFYAVAIIMAALAGLFGLFAGLALLAGGASARSLALVAAFFSLSDLPLGTSLGIYTLVIFLR
jgi:hypothetical protein